MLEVRTNLTERAAELGDSVSANIALTGKHAIELIGQTSMKNLKASAAKLAEALELCEAASSKPPLPQTIEAVNAERIDKKELSTCSRPFARRPTHRPSTWRTRTSETIAMSRLGCWSMA